MTRLVKPPRPPAKDPDPLSLRTRAKEFLATKKPVAVVPDHPLLKPVTGNVLHGWKATGEVTLYQPEVSGMPEPWIFHGIENPSRGESADIVYHPLGKGRYGVDIRDREGYSKPESLTRARVDVERGKLPHGKIGRLMEAHGRLAGGIMDTKYPLTPIFNVPAGVPNVAWGKGALGSVQEPKGMAFVPVKNKGELPPSTSRKLLKG